ncbi:MAG TPA: BON domain-containing protein [Noviherbaspirillum sp.]|uniref:BON domain-containing protein n=1 Tax=Bordetella sp. TaxID=28081 RepID=UPI002ED1ECBB
MKNAFRSYGITFNDDSNSASDTVRAMRREAVLDALSKHGPFRFAAFACGLALALSCTLAPGLAAAQTATPQTNDSNAGAADQSEHVATDSWITTKVKSALLADSVSKGIDVGVETTNGVVVLSGKLPTSAAIEHVKLITQGIQGVKHVDTSALTVGAS